MQEWVLSGRVNTHLLKILKHNDYECKLRHGEESPFTIVEKSVKVEYSTGNVLIDDVGVGENTKDTSADDIPF